MRQREEVQDLLWFPKGIDAIGLRAAGRMKGGVSYDPASQIDTQSVFEVEKFLQPGPRVNGRLAVGGVSRKSV